MNGTPSALHARRKNHVEYEEMMGLSSLSQRSIEMLPQQSTLPSKRSNSKRMLTKQSLLEVQMTYVVVSVFVFIGFIFGYLLLHHQHRRVIVHVIRNPWAHGRAAFHMPQHGIDIRPRMASIIIFIVVILNLLPLLCPQW